MKQILFGAVILSALTIVACDDTKPRVDTAATPSTGSTAMPGVTGQPEQTGLQQTGTTPNSTSPVVTPVPAPGTTPVPAQTAGLNPAHGEPGHTCAIPVGAPLSSAPAAGSAPPAPTITTTTAPSNGPTINAAPAPAPATAPPISITPAPAAGQGMGGSARLNPAHGQPGHTCAVPVGQPLP
jgi:hypothetical protein